jgi:hypothetical protein
VLEAVGAGALGAVVGGHARRVDERLAGCVVALLLVRVEGRLGWEGGGRVGGALAGPGAGLGAFVRVLGAVVEAVCPVGVSMVAWEGLG